MPCHLRLVLLPVVRSTAPCRRRTFTLGQEAHAVLARHDAVAAAAPIRGSWSLRPPGITVANVTKRVGLLVLAILAATGCSASGQHAAAPAAAGTTHARPAAGSGIPGADRCSAALTDSPLPAWARAGFQPPGQPMPHVLGADGNIVAIVWAGLYAPPLRGQANKILWVSRQAQRPGAALRIRALLLGGHRAAERVISGGAGPSYVNLPAAGCWAVRLSWSGHRDHLWLRYSTR